MGCNYKAIAPKKNNCLHIAAEFCTPSFLEIFLDKGIEINDVNGCGMEAIHIAAAEGLVDNLKYLILRRANINSMSNENMTPLHYAVKSRRLDVCNYLINKDVNMIKDKNGLTPYELAIRMEFNDIVELFDSKNKNPRIDDPHDEIGKKFAPKKARRRKKNSNVSTSSSEKSQYASNNHVINKDSSVKTPDKSINQDKNYPLEKIETNGTPTSINKELYGSKGKKSNTDNEKLSNGIDNNMKDRNKEVNEKITLNSMRDSSNTITKATKKNGVKKLSGLSSSKFKKKNILARHQSSIKKIDNTGNNISAPPNIDDKSIIDKIGTRQQNNNEEQCKLNNNKENSSINISNISVKKDKQVEEESIIINPLTPQKVSLKKVKKIVKKKGKKPLTKFSSSKIKIGSNSISTKKEIATVSYSNDAQHIKQTVEEISSIDNKSDDAQIIERNMEIEKKNNQEKGESSEGSTILSQNQPNISIEMTSNIPQDQNIKINTQSNSNYSKLLSTGSDIVKENQYDVSSDPYNYFFQNSLQKIKQQDIPNLTDLPINDSDISNENQPNFDSNNEIILGQQHDNVLLDIPNLNILQESESHNKNGYQIDISTNCGLSNNQIMNISQQELPIIPSLIENTTDVTNGCSLDLNNKGINFEILNQNIECKQNNMQYDANFPEDDLKILITNHSNDPSANSAITNEAQSKISVPTNLMPDNSMFLRSENMDFIEIPVFISSEDADISSQVYSDSVIHKRKKRKIKYPKSLKSKGPNSVEGNIIPEVHPDLCSSVHQLSPKGQQIYLEDDGKDITRNNYVNEQGPINNIISPSSTTSSITNNNYIVVDKNDIIRFPQGVSSHESYSDLNDKYFNDDIFIDKDLLNSETMIQNISSKMECTSEKKQFILQSSQPISIHLEDSDKSLKESKMQFFIHHFPAINIENGDFYSYESEEIVTLQTESEIIFSSSRDNEEQVYQLYQGNNDFDNYRDLITYIKNDELEKVKDLVYMRYPEHVTSRHSTPLHVAAHYNKPVILKYLITQCNNIDSIDSRGMTPLARACEGGFFECVKILIREGANAGIKNINNKPAIDSCNCNGFTLLHREASKRNIRNVIFLLKNGANPIAANKYDIPAIDCPDYEGNTLLHLATLNENLKIVKLLIEYKASPKIKNNKGKKPLDIALEIQNKSLRRNVIKALSDSHEV